MHQQPISKLLPFAKIIKLLIILSLSLQLIVISQVYFFGNQQSHTLADLVAQLLRGTALTIFGVFILTYPNLFLIGYLNKFFPWKKHLVKRFVIQFPVSIFIGVLVTPLILFFASRIMTFKEDLHIIFINNAYYFALANLFLMTIFEAWIYFSESTQAKLKAENLEKELSDYLRYVLLSNSKEESTLQEELENFEKFFQLQKLRFDMNLTVEINIQPTSLPLHIQPLASQMLVDNCIKHNIISAKNPLHIKIFDDEKKITVLNNLQLKHTEESTGQGLKNIEGRFRFISNEPIKVVSDGKQFSVTILLIIHNLQYEKNTHY